MLSKGAWQRKAYCQIQVGHVFIIIHDTLQLLHSLHLCRKPRASIWIGSEAMTQTKKRSRAGACHSALITDVHRQEWERTRLMRLTRDSSTCRRLFTVRTVSSSRLDTCKPRHAALHRRPTRCLGGQHLAIKPETCQDALLAGTWSNARLVCSQSEGWQNRSAVL